jgi:6-phosphogluconate dehydrogenase
VRETVTEDLIAAIKAELENAWEQTRNATADEIEPLREPNTETAMQLGMVGLGRMGSNMVRRLVRGGHECVVYNRSEPAISDVVRDGAIGAKSLDELVAKLTPPRAIWVMLPAGDVTEKTVLSLAAAVKPDDVIIDGGNSYYKDDVRRAEALHARSIHYVDVGTSGGVWGLERGYCLMIGGKQEIFQRLDPIFRTLAPGRGETPLTPGRTTSTTADEGYLYCGPVGAGHFVKMIHNGIEYGVMQAYGEGFNILFNADSANLPANMRYELPMAEIAEVWRRGSVISSWLLDLLAISLVGDPKLSKFSGSVQDSGEGRWTIVAALEEAVPADVLAASVNVRFRSRQEHVFAEKVLSAMRFQFGGHKEQPMGGLSPTA